MRKLVLAAAAVAAILSFGAPAERANAMPVASPAALGAAAADVSAVQQVYWARRGWGWRHRAWVHRGWGWRHHWVHRPYWGWRHRYWVHRRYWGWRHYYWGGYYRPRPWIGFGFYRPWGGWGWRRPWW